MVTSALLHVPNQSDFFWNSGPTQRNEWLFLSSRSS